VIKIGREVTSSKAAQDDGCGVPAHTRFFDNQAHSYSRFYNPETKTGAAYLFQLRQQFAVALLEGEPRDRLLDLATGTGELTLAVAEACGAKQLLLNDLSAAMLERCRETFDTRSGAWNVEWSTEDAFARLAAVEKGSLDLLLCLGLIAHTGRLGELLEKAYVALRPGGALLLQSSLVDHPGAWLTAAYARSRLRRTPYRVCAFSVRDIKAAAAEAGLIWEAERRYGLCLPFGDRLLGRLNYSLENCFATRLTARGAEALILLRKPA